VGIELYRADPEPPGLRTFGNVLNGAESDWYERGFRRLSWTAQALPHAPFFEQPMRPPMSCRLGVMAYGSEPTKRNINRETRHVWAVVLWPISLLLWTPAALLFRSAIVARRRVMTGICTECGYLLAGLAAGALCPECGTVRSRAQRMSAGSEEIQSNGRRENADGGTK
jgi:hypothetical protein